MILKQLNHTNLSVSPICLGTAQFGTGLSEKDAKQQLNEFHDLGGNFIDTANVYGNWIDGLESPSEKLIGGWFRESGKRNEMVLTTKGGHPALDHMDIPRLQSEDIEHDIENSLRFMQTDYIDLYLLHRDDPSIPVSNILDCLDTFVAQGKIRYYGCSNWTLPRIIKAADYADQKGSKGFVVNQLMWSLADINRHALPDKTLVTMDKSTFTYHKTRGMNAMAYMSLAHGFFSKQASGNELPAPLADIYKNRTNAEIYEAGLESVKEGTYSFIDLSLMYLMNIKDFPVIPAASFTTIEQFREAMNCLRKPVPEVLLEKLSGLKEL